MEWKFIIDYPNYTINFLGEVRNITTGKTLKNTISTNGYWRVGLWKNKKSIYPLVHRLIAIHFIPNPDNKPCIDHINRIRSDNRLQNLRWATYSENGQNRSIGKTNKLKEQYICKDGEYYRFDKVINGICHRKHFKTLEEAIEYRDLFISNIQTDLL